jgi:hypothetical protein
MAKKPEKGVGVTIQSIIKNSPIRRAYGLTPTITIGYVLSNHCYGFLPKMNLELSNLYNINSIDIRNI